MKLTILILLILLSPGAHALEVTAPEAPPEVSQFMPEETGEIGTGFWQMVKKAIASIRPDLAEAGRICLGIFAVVLLISMIHTIPGAGTQAVDIAGSVGISILFLRSANSLISLAADTVRQLSDYGKLLLPVLASSLAAQGGVGTSTAIYAGTVAFDAVLSTVVRQVLLPLMYIYLVLCICHGALGEEMLRKMGDFIKWLATWVLKTVLYVFTGYMGITGVVSGTTDAAALKAAKITISGAVPVVGGILADASEAVLVGAGLVKNAAGVYGILALAAVVIGPFFRIGIHYLLLKTTGALCGIIAQKQHAALIADFSAVMGLLLAMTGSICLLLMISVVCFLRGVG